MAAYLLKPTGFSRGLRTRCTFGKGQKCTAPAIDGETFERARRTFEKAKSARSSIQPRVAVSSRGRRRPVAGGDATP